MENEYKVEETDFGTRTSHPSYGTIMFNRSNSRVTPLFGSSIKHNNVITMELRHAEIERGLNRDWVYGKAPIAEIEMSYSQFAEAITSFGQGTGIPVTIRYTEKMVKYLLVILLVKENSLLMNSKVKQRKQ